MALLKLVLVAHLIIYGFSAFVGLICFIKDVSKWHIAEKKVEIISSAERSEENGRNGNTGDNGDTGDGNDNDSTGDRDGDGDNNNRYSDDW